MTNVRFRRLEQFRTGGTGDRMDLLLPVPRSLKGRIHRYCPNEECTPRRFQLGEAPSDQSIAPNNSALVRRSPGVVGTTCPYCGIDADDQEFTAREDVENAKKLLKWAASEDIGDWAEGLAKDFNRRMPKGGLISLSMKTRRSRTARPYPRREDLLRGLTCDICGRNYGVYAIALFCPDCGARNVHVHFAREVSIVERQVDMAQAAAEEGDDELGFRLLGNAHEDVLTALETYLRTLFLFLVERRLDSEKNVKVCKIARRGNPFQSIERGEHLFAQLNASPYAVLGEDDRGFLSALIEKRRVIGHNLGLVDEKYLRAVSNATEGENISLLAGDVRRFAQLALQVVVEGLEQTEREFLPGS